MNMHSDQFDDATGVFCSMAPDPEDEARWDAVAELEHRLVHAGGAHDLALNIDLALLGLERHVLGATAQQLEPQDRDRLVAALSTATSRAYLAPPRGLDRRQAIAGMLMIAHTIEFWALPDSVRNARGKLRSHLRSLLRVFRNALHNACLLNDLVEDVEAMAPWHDLCGDAPPDLQQIQHLLSHPIEAVYGFIGAYSATSEKRG